MQPVRYLPVLHESAALEAAAGAPRAAQLSDDEIRERMSGNICRCGAYPGIVAAIREVEKSSVSG